MNKGRATRPVRRMGTEIHADRRTRRRRTRGDDEREAIMEAMRVQRWPEDEEELEFDDYPERAPRRRANY